MNKMFHFVYADEEGNGYINEDYFGLGLLGANFVEPGDSVTGRRQFNDDSQSHSCCNQ